MKRTECIALSSLISLFSLQVAESQPSQTEVAINASTPTNYTVVERGANHRVVRYRTVETNLIGDHAIVRTNAHSYTEIETGMHRKNSQGDWVEASDEIESSPGGAAATNSAHQVFFAANANSSEAVRLTMPDGRVLASHVLCLSYFDAVTGSNAIIAELRDSIGQIVATNQVLYTNAFSGDCDADIVYQNTKSGLEQNIILRSQPPSPAEYGISNATLQVWTEFVSSPTPSVIPSQNPSVSADEQFDFGGMMIGPGKALIIGGATNAPVRVEKQWVKTQGRTFLVEQVPLQSTTSLLQQLSPSSGGSGAGGQGQHASVSPAFLKLRFAQARTAAMQAAKLQPKKRPEFVMDYNLTSATNFVFQADTTYYVSGSVLLAGSNVFEGGCVLKYAADAQINIYPVGSTNTLTFLGAPYRPSIFTAKDDQSIGDIISGSASSPSGYYANPALLLVGISQPPLIAHVRVAYANKGILTSGSSINVSDAQFVNCANPFQVTGGTVSLRNVLLANCVTNFVLQGGITVTAENATFAACNCVAAGPSSPGGCAMSLTNCILSDVTNLAAGVLSLSGDTNGFWNSPTVGNVVTNSFYPFQVIGAGGFYLASGCSFRNAGTPNINSTLLTSLGQKTTYPPIVLSNIISTDTVLSPQAQRDTDTPDLGYHYDPIDYALKGARLTNATLSVSAGTAISTAGQYGLGLWSGSKFISSGTATNLNRVARYNLVQENSNTNWNGKGVSFYDNWFGGSVLPRFSAAFTDFTMPSQDSFHLNLSYSGGDFSFVNCQIHAGSLYAGWPNITLTNCLLERVNTAISDDSGVISPTIRNCLFFAGWLYLGHFESGTWLLRDNLFDRAALSQDGDMDAAYDGYASNTTRLTPTNAHDIVLSSTDYQAGTLGNYYYPTRGGNLSSLINAGSTNANWVGLYHYTATTNLVSGLQIKETNSVVDIGFHYVATDSTGKPIDSNGDGLPDYQSDANGNGTVDSGETGWNLANDAGLGIWISRPGNN